MKCNAYPGIIQGHLNERLCDERIQAIELGGKKRIVRDDEKWYGCEGNSQAIRSICIDDKTRTEA
ncbi:MAG: hypothetical protein WCW33_05555 [Candidatus Babeliales bacterium]|jgi:hypothetical protein